MRALTADQQVALLFVTLFGLLLAASVAAMVIALRQDRDALPEVGRAAAARRRQRRLAQLRALWLGALVFWAAWVSGPLGATLAFGALSFFALREFVTLAPTRRSDHRTLLLAFFAVLPLQYVLVGSRSFDLFTVFVPVYVFLAIPVVSALAGDPHRFLERNAKIQWGITVCVYGLSHAPALLLLQFPRVVGRGAFLVFFLVVVVTLAQIGQELAGRRMRRRPLARHIDRSFSGRGWAAGTATGAAFGAVLFWITPFSALQAAALGAIAGGSGLLGEFVVKALKRDAGLRPSWGREASVTGAVGLLDRVAPLCFAAPVFFHSVRWYFQLQA